MTLKRGDEVTAARDLALGHDVLIRIGCPGRVVQRIGSLAPKYTVRFMSRNDDIPNKLIVRGLVDMDLEQASMVEARFVGVGINRRKRISPAP